MGPLSALRHAVFAFLAAHQYGGLFLLLLVEEAGVPVPLPGDKLVMYQGVRARDGHANAALVLLLVSAAVWLGSSALYGAGRWGGRAALLRYGRFLRLKPERLDRIEARFRRWGPWAVFVGRLVPGCRVPTSLLAGVFAVPCRVYLPCAALAAVAWTGFYFYAGMLLERPARRALAYFRQDLDAAVGATLLLLALGLAVAVAVRGVRRARRGGADAPARA